MGGGELAFFRLSAGLAGLCAVALTTPATAATPTFIWTGVNRVNLLCNVAGAPGLDYIGTAAELCREVEKLARKGSPVPVRVIPIGDPDVLAADAVTLLVHASVTPQARGRLLAFAIRPYRPAAEQASVLFGAAPRAAVISSDRVTSAALRAALEGALNETLPWRARAPGAQPLTNHN